MKLDKYLSNKLSKDQLIESFSNKKLELTLFPTEQCNLRCTYCYEDFEIGKMTPEIVVAIKKLISKRIDDLELLILSWFGGEPLVAKDILMDISQYAYTLCQEKGVSFSGGLTTNAYLLDFESFERLIELRQKSFQITLDGYKEQHDKTRIRTNGKGTFDKIWANLLSCRQSDKDFHITLRIHVNHENFESLKVLCHKINKEFGSDSRYSSYFHDVRNLGGAGGKSVIKISKETYNEQLEELTKIVSQDLSNANVSAAPFGGAESSTSIVYDEGKLIREKEVYICYASKPNHYLIRADGRIGKCTVGLDSPANTIGVLNNDGTLKLNIEKTKLWMKGFDSLDENELGCPFAHIPEIRNSDEYLLSLT